jgi:malonyl CoA-acyl carrier protein transacylase
MAAVTAEQRPELLAQAREELGADPFEQIGDGTHMAQPALYCASLAHWGRAGSPTGALLSGHSLGELAALVAGGALDQAEGLTLAVARGRLMEDAGTVHPGGMVAALGGEEEIVRKIAARFELTVANDNAPGQLVLSGDAEKVGEARKELRASGAKAIRLPVAGAFHSPLMEPAVEGFAAALAATDFRAPETTVVSSTSTEPFAAGEIAERLAAALTEPVLWRQTLAAMYEDGAREFLETGPGDILTGLGRRCLPEDAESRSLAELETADA